MAKQNGNVDPPRGSEGGQSEPADVLLIAAPHVAVEGLRSYIRRSPMLRLVAEVEPGEEVLAQVARHRPGHLIIASDGVTKEMMGLLQRLREAAPDTRLVVCTNEFEPDVMTELVCLPAEAILAWRELSLDDLQQAVEAAARGKNYFSQAATQAVADALAHRQRLLNERTGLSEREKEALRALGTTCKNAEAAKRLRVGKRRFEDIVNALKSKLGVSTLFMLGVWAHALGLVDVDQEPERPAER